MASKGELPTAIDFVLGEKTTGNLPEISSIGDWTSFYSQISGEWHFSVDCAIVGGFCAEKVSFAFLSGFRSALQSLIPELPKDQFIAFCVSEEGGNHPGAIETTLTRSSENGGNNGIWHLSGKKAFITGADSADKILVAASIGVNAAGLNQIRVVSVNRKTPGVFIDLMPPLPFLPEIKHASVRFETVKVLDTQFMPGDGYDAYIKPFRILEDLHVAGALLGYLFKIGKQYHWPQEIQEEGVILMAMVGELVASNPFSTAAHIKFGGFDALMRQLLMKAEPYWKGVPVSVSEAWRRDSQVMKVAEKARKRRLEKAWNDLKDI